MDVSKNYYQILEIERNADQSKIKSAYRKLALKYHPDKNPSSESKLQFQQISEAYNILSDDKQKGQYDIKSVHGSGYQGSNYFFNFNAGVHSGYEENLNLNMEVSVTLEDIYTNNSKEIKYQRNKNCSNCDGTGFEQNEQYSECLFCNGKGKNVDGSKCKYCHGKGKLYRNKCSQCNGNKVVPSMQSLTLNNIFTVNGKVKTIKYDNYGHQSKYFRDKAGILTLFLIPAKNSNFTRQGDDLFQNLKINFDEAILGKEIELNLPDNKLYKIKIPPKTKPDAILKIDGKGFLKKNKTRGNFYIQINVDIDYNQISQQLIEFLHEEQQRKSIQNEDI